ncbi:unnamed protein product [Darwinula stevensoni]|uniref:Protein Wnt n=1 Tax=Darwinula stevensoni TaxID=69355 RepID=A0A7R8XAG1_9CRUS|nr:unnamed protein product [Darwinula stevensoni]CAG0889966.1 unnamed protein product [Darwinula stevensoni]
MKVARRKELAEEEEETRLRSLESVLMPAAKRHGHGGRRTRGALPRGDLIHLRKSPDYCRRDVKRGIPGTSGRVCNKTNDASRPDSCQVLCCGRGYNTQVVIHVEKCACKFHWCCYVTCKKCTTKTDVYTCK